MANDIPETTRDNTKKIVGFIAGVSVGSVVKEIIKQNVEKSGFGYIAIPVGTMIIASMASKAASDYTDSKLDSIFEMLEDNDIIQRNEIPTE